MEVLSMLAVIGIIIFTVINLIIYHKIFTVTYFNLSKGCFTELFFAWFVAMFEVGLIVLLGRTVLSGLLKVLGFAGKIVLIVLVISLVVFAVNKIVQLIKGMGDTGETKEPDNDIVQNNQEMDEEKESEDIPLEVESAASDIEMGETGEELDIEVTEVGPNKVKVIRAIRETTGLGLVEAKDFVDSSARTLKRVSREKADNIKAKLEAEGARVILKLPQELGTMPGKQHNEHMVACTNCGKMIKEDAKFCNFCGSKIPPMDTAVCANCGNPITLNANFCHYCGEKIRKDN